VLIDDLITKEIDEPYRMFTSRAEYRILLRQGSADLRLTPMGHRIGLASEARFKRVNQKQEGIQRVIKFLNEESIDLAASNALMENKGISLLKQKVKAGSLLLRPQMAIQDLHGAVPGWETLLNALPDDLVPEILDEAETTLKYGSYIEKERELASRMEKYEHFKLHPDTDYHQISALSFESRDKLNRFKPATIGQASRINGVSPADIAVLLVLNNR
jgi:tRNA uridine 5-carboxymethylaminomethyl modification enzyme